MNKKYHIIAVTLLIIFSFYGGMKYSQYQKSSIARNFGGGGNRVGQIGVMGSTTNQKMNRLNLGGMINGEIISKDDTGITLKQKDGGSRIIFFSGKTLITKSSSATKDELKSGLQITGQGTPNPDGSITAESIQIK